MYLSLSISRVYSIERFVLTHLTYIHTYILSYDYERERNKPNQSYILKARWLEAGIHRTMLVLYLILAIFDALPEVPYFAIDIL